MFSHVKVVNDKGNKQIPKWIYQIAQIYFLLKVVITFHAMKVVMGSVLPKTALLLEHVEVIISTWNSGIYLAIHT